MTANAVFIKRGLNESEAALYVGIGITLFRAMVGDGRYPPPRLQNARKVWDRIELDAAFDDLPRAQAKDTWEGVGNGGS